MRFSPNSWLGGHVGTENISSTLGEEKGPIEVQGKCVRTSSDMPKQSMLKWPMIFLASAAVVPVLMRTCKVYDTYLIGYI